MTMTRRTFGLGASAVLAGPIAAPFIRSAGAAEPAIRIGMVNSMSGGLAAYAQEGQPAFEYIIKKINAEGGIKSKGGARIELVLADDTSQPARTAAEARRLITEEKVQPDRHHSQRTDAGADAGGRRSQDSDAVGLGRWVAVELYVHAGIPV